MHCTSILEQIKQLQLWTTVTICMNYQKRNLPKFLVNVPENTPAATETKQKVFEVSQNFV